MITSHPIATLPDKEYPPSVMAAEFRRSYLKHIEMKSFIFYIVKKAEASVWQTDEVSTRLDIVACASTVQFVLLSIQ